MTSTPVRRAPHAPVANADSNAHARRVSLGLRANLPQFVLLMVINAFVGGMVGLERSVLPLIASTDFGVASKSAALAFIAAFGLTKALANLATGWLINVHGRRWTLIMGWLVALPVPWLVLWAPAWSWIVVANALLGINQGLAWSTTVIMKIDLVGPRRRGLAMGLNEFAGYVAVACAALGSGIAANRYGLRPGAAYPGMAIAATGLLLSCFFVRDTAGHVQLEEREHAHAGESARHVSTRQLLRRSVWSDGALFSVSQAGLVNNLNDGMAWGLFPLLFTRAGLSLSTMSGLAALYPATWGICQIWTGAISDRWGRKWLIVSGMIIQGLSLLGVVVARGVVGWAASLALLGIGTALVYPTLLASVGDMAHPSWRAAAVGVYRLWRDLGYVVGALLCGVLADAFGMTSAISVVALLTIVSGMVVAARMPETHPRLTSFPAGP